MENYWGRFDSEVMILVEKIVEMNVCFFFYKFFEREIILCWVLLKKGGFCLWRDFYWCLFYGFIILCDENGYFLLILEIDIVEFKLVENELMKEFVEVSMGGFYFVLSLLGGVFLFIFEVELVM